MLEISYADLALGVSYIKVLGFRICMILIIYRGAQAGPAWPVGVVLDHGSEA